MSNLSLFLALCVPRIVYVLFTEQRAGDTDLYNRIASNILAGCGFSASTEPRFCDPIIGGYFPGYPFFLSIFHYFDLSNKLVAVVTAVLFVFSIIYLRRAMEVFTGHVRISLLICVGLGLSPLTIGFSRFILIEPILTAFSVLILAQSLIYLKREKKFDLLILLILVSISVYFKPTSVIFVAPLILILVFVKKINFFLGFTIAAALLFAAVLPWELRNRDLGNESLLTGTSNIYPDVQGYNSWLKTWVITEYERGYATFPVWRGEPYDVQIKKNLFLSESEASHARSLITAHLAGAGKWDAALDSRFHSLAQSRLEHQSLFEFIALRAGQTAAVLLHPANSWGFPLRLSLARPVEWASKDFILKSAGKAILFTYRLFLFLLFLYFFLYAVRSFLCHWYYSMKNIQSSLSADSSTSSSKVAIPKAGSQFAWANVELNTSAFQLISLSLALLIASVFLHVFLFFGLEHRYFVPVVPWIETAVFYAILIRLRRFR
jgi:hypothetical protein